MSSISMNLKNRRARGGTFAPGELFLDTGYPIQATPPRPTPGRTRATSIVSGLACLSLILTIFNASVNICHLGHQYAPMLSAAQRLGRFLPLADHVGHLCHILSPSILQNGRLDARLRAMEDKLGYGQGGDVDVALIGSGAYVIPNLTSPPNHLDLSKVTGESVSIWSRLFPQWISRSIRTTITQAEIVPASIILEDLIINGDCWAFGGPSGHVAILFPSSINITGITVHYVHPGGLLPLVQQRAPRHVILWALREDKPGVSKATMGPARPASSFLTSSQSLPTSISESAIFYPILEAEYTISKHRPVQTFHLATPARILTQVVVIEILSNWGADSTCLYHIGVHANFDLDTDT